MSGGDRPDPTLAEAISATGGIAVALGVLLIAIDVYADHPSRGAEVALFAGLVLAGALVVLLAPRDFHPAGVTAIVAGIPGVFGWWLLPHAHRFADIRPFLILTIVAWLACFVVRQFGNRPIFLGLAALFLWLWILGEVAGTDAYSARPIPSPPAHTLFSLTALHLQTSTPTLSDLDSSDPLYPLAQSCDDFHDSSCLQLYNSAPAGSDFQQFGATCGGTTDGTTPGCETVSTGPIQQNPPIRVNPLPSVASNTSNKATEIGFVSVLFGLGYLAALWVLDRRNRARLGTAFVLPGAVALITGTQSLGNAAHHAWVGGLLTVIAGLVIGTIGDRTNRRFTAWFGGFTVAVGAITIALDAAHIRRSVSNGNVKLAGPGMIVVAFGIALAGLAYLVARVLHRPESAGGVDANPVPPSNPLVGASVGSAPAVVAPADPSPWAPPPVASPPVAPPPASPPPVAPPPAGPPPVAPPSWPPPPGTQ